MRVIIREANLVSGSSVQNSKNPEIFPTHLNPLYSTGPYRPLIVMGWSSILFLGGVTGLFLSNENTIGPAIDLLALVLREASGDWSR